MLAQMRGRTDGVLPIDDNLAPRLFLPVTAAMLGDDPVLPDEALRGTPGGSATPAERVGSFPH
jgi:hypothetical protein